MFYYPSIKEVEYIVGRDFRAASETVRNLIRVKRVKQNKGNLEMASLFPLQMHIPSTLFLVCVCSKEKNEAILANSAASLSEKTTKIRNCQK